MAIAARTPPFPYQPLMVNEIRALWFDEEENTSPTLELKLRHIKRPSSESSNSEGSELGSPPYHALSWAWGQGNANRLVLIDKREFYICETLHDALYHIRSDTSVRGTSFLLWIDAICINQTDEDEKSIQVLHMRETYKDACKVIVWLGTSPCPERRETTRKAASFLTERIPPIPDGLMYTGPVPKYLLEQENAAVVRTICQDVLRRPWWWRMWVIQEVALARSIVVICDGHRFSWEHLMYVSQWIRILDINLLKPEAGGPADQNPFLPNINFKGMYRHKLVFDGDVDLPILEVLQNASSCLATNPRDMIYALLGMSTDIESSEAVNDEHKLVVDYKRRSVAEVYIDFAKIHIHTHENNPLNVITFSRFNPSPEHDLPSWVPDWSNLRETSCFSLANPTVPSALRATLVNHYSYRASGARRAEFEITPGLGLRVTGIQFDSVSRVGLPFLGGPSAEFERVIHDWLVLAFGDDPQGYGAPYLGSDQTLLDIFDRTITVDTSAEGSRVTPGRGYLFRCLMVQRAAGRIDLRGTDPRVMVRSLARELEALGRAAEVRMVRRRFFKTSRGFFGLGPRDMEEGDKVFVLYGCSVPVVLRRRGEHWKCVPAVLRRRGEHWKLVGEAFVAGIMDGEVVRAADNPDSGTAEGGVPVSLLKGSEKRVEIK